ncbi:hypothetical protein AB4Z42_08890 [Mycobacterium sp. 2YAF39]|uniref:hypothetical protein n=1 Tax=Mycobacterium sp. 2YAF39 TaxID=3233033 RepID=UPI003F987148
MTDPSTVEPIDRWARSAHPERRCTAHRKNGDQCKNAARHGTNVCDFHGAKAPQVKRKARQRIEEAADRMACELLKMATDDNVADSIKLAAIRDALDRAGLAAKNAVEVEVGPPKPYEQILNGLVVIGGGSRAEYRRSIGRPDDSDADHTRPAADRLRKLPTADAESFDTGLVGYQTHRRVQRRPAGENRQRD